MSNPNPQGVRRAEPADIETLTESAVFIYTESALQPVSRPKVEALVTRCVTRDRAIAGIIDGGDGIEASIGLAVESLPYSDDEHLEVAWLGVHPLFRRSQHALKLVEFATWAQGIMEVPLFLEVNTQDELSGKLHLVFRMVPQISARFCRGNLPAGAFTQREIGHDPHGERMRSRAKFAVRQAA